MFPIQDVINKLKLITPFESSQFGTNYNTNPTYFNTSSKVSQTSTPFRYMLLTEEANKPSKIKHNKTLFSRTTGAELHK